MTVRPNNKCKFFFAFLLIVYLYLFVRLNMVDDSITHLSISKLEFGRKFERKEGKKITYLLQTN